MCGDYAGYCESGLKKGNLQYQFIITNLQWKVAVKTIAAPARRQTASSGENEEEEESSAEEEDEDAEWPQKKQQKHDYTFRFKCWKMVGSEV